MKIKTALVLPDLQCPFEDKRTLAVVEKYMAENKWDYLIYMGDFLDYFTISRFNEGKPGNIEGRTIIQELKKGEDVLDRHIKIVRDKNPDCEVYYLEGNHEARAYDFTSRFPHLKGLIEPENALKFDEKGIKYIRSWTNGETLKIGKAMFTHGNYTNLHHAKKMVEAYEDNIFYGHTHDCNSFNKTSKGTGKTKVGQSLGCLCDYPKEVDYMKGRPSNWQQAFAVFNFRDKGYFNYNLVRIPEDRKFLINGKIYC